MHVLHLRLNVRLLNSTLSRTSINDEQAFEKWLLSVGHGKDIVPDGTIAFDARSMRVNTVDDLINCIYPHICDAVPPSQYFLDHLILAPRNTDVDQLNSAVLSKLPGEE